MKQACNLISLVATAITTDTVEEALQYLTERFDMEDEVVKHTYRVLNQILSTTITI
jgi:hypothetical protein